MEARELRIGNKLLRPNGNIAEVTWGVIKDVEAGDRTYQPIPLAEEWLEKMGIEPAKIIHSLEPVGLSYDLIRDGNKWNIEYLYSDHHGCVIIEGIEFVHTFQNAVYALTGKDLEVKS